MEKLSPQITEAVNFAKRAQVQTGFGYLDPDGTVDSSRPVELWITCRMTYVFALATLLGMPDAEDYLRHGVKALTEYFQDPAHGGWYAAIEAQPDSAGRGVPVNDRKEAYGHAFVLLAANAALAADDSDAGLLLAKALESQDKHWFDADSGKVVESYTRPFSETESYRGINANMHTVEAYLATSDLTGNRELLDRAVGILKFVAEQAGSHDWRIPEHYDSDWRPDLEFNRDYPAHPFRPFGATPGHGLEWARLMLQARASLQSTGTEPPEWMLPVALELYDRAVSDGWNVDGAPGFIYTTDFSGQPVNRQRMHWVVCEAVGAALVLSKVLEQEDPESPRLPILAKQIAQWQDYIDKYLMEDTGRIIHELDPENAPASDTWPGKPDVYHFLQMLLLPKLPVTPSFAAALRGGKYGENSASD